jgi:hypothetical protein
MPLVFVHGVANRRGESAAEQAAFDRRVLARDGLFRTIALADQVQTPAVLHIENPYWGDLAAHFAWNLSSVPRGGDEALGADVLGTEAGRQSEAGRLTQVALATTTGKAAAVPQQPTTLLVTLARQESLVFAVDAVFAAAAQVSSAAAVASDAEVATFAARAVAYALVNPHPSWLGAVKNDNAFLEQLSAAVATFQPAGQAPPVPPHIEALGGANVLNHLKNAALRLGNAAKNVFTGMAEDALDKLAGKIGDATESLVLKARPAISTLVGRFFGDIFVYVQSRGTKDDPGPIVKTVIEAIDAAIAAKTDHDDKLYIVAHSMGGQIVYDILTFYRPEIACDLLVTVGSQVGFFEELKLLKMSNPTIHAGSVPSTVPRPANIARWINIFDLTDVFGFTEAGIFDGVANFEFDTETLPVLSHVMYFERPRLHERLRARIAGVFA